MRYYILYALVVKLSGPVFNRISHRYRRYGDASFPALFPTVMSRKRTKVVYLSPDEKHTVEQAVDAFFDGHGDDIPNGVAVAQICEQFLSQQ